MAICKAVHTNEAGIFGAMAQPTTLREYRSSTAARYSKPARADVGDIGYPRLIGRRWIELSIEAVLGHRQRMLAVGDMHELSLQLGRKPCGRIRRRTR
jgi:hypothetical protein